MLRGGNGLLSADEDCVGDADDGGEVVAPETSVAISLPLLIYLIEIFHPSKMRLMPARLNLRFSLSRWWSGR